MTRGAPMEARAEEWRQMEPPADDEPVPDARIAGDTFPENGTLDLDEIEDRSLLAISLRPSAFPATKSVLLEVAEEQHAQPRVISWLQRLEPDVTFHNVEHVWEALGGRYEQREHRPTETEHAPEQHVESPSLIPRALITRAVGLGKAGMEVGIGFAVAGVTSVTQRVRRLVQ